MASFDPTERQPVAEVDSVNRKLPRHFFESSLQRFLGTFPQLIEQLEQHCSRLREYHRHGDGTRMRAELINASHTINRGQRSQQEFKNVRADIPIDILEKYERSFVGNSEKLELAIEAMIGVAKQVTGSSRVETVGQSSAESSSTNTTVDDECAEFECSSWQSGSAGQAGSHSHRCRHPRPPCIASSTGSLQFFYTESEDESACRHGHGGSLDIAYPPDPPLGTGQRQHLHQDQEHLPVQRLSAFTSPEEAENFNKLMHDVEELNDVIHTFANSVQEQREFVDSISSHVEDSAVAIQEGTVSLGVAAKLKSALLPVACGTVGAVIAGPVGLFAGLKLGAVAAAGAAGVGGVLIGRKIKNKKDEQIERDMAAISPPSSR